MANRFFLKPLKWFLGAGIIICVAFGAGQLHLRFTDGFNIQNITSTYVHDKKWTITSLLPKKEELLDDIFSQQFHYMAMGRQAYVFISEDQRYILKFPKLQRFRLNPIWLSLPLPEAWVHYRQKKIDRKRRGLEKLFASWKIAYEELPRATGVIYVHINNSDRWNRTVTLIDKMGNTHAVDMQDKVFLVQKRVPLFFPHLKCLMEEGKVYKAKRLLRQLIGLYVAEFDQGITDMDRNPLRNMGLRKGRPIHLDIGRFKWDRRLPNSQLYPELILEKTIDVRRWLRARYPELADDFEGKIQAWSTLSKPVNCRRA